MAWQFPGYHEGLVSTNALVHMQEHFMHVWVLKVLISRTFCLRKHGTNKKYWSTTFSAPYMLEDVKHALNPLALAHMLSHTTYASRWAHTSTAE